MLKLCTLASLIAVAKVQKKYHVSKKMEDLLCVPLYRVKYAKKMRTNQLEKYA